MDAEKRAQRAAELHQQIIERGASPQARGMWRELQLLLAQQRAEEKPDPNQEQDELPF